MNIFENFGFVDLIVSKKIPNPSRVLIDHNSIRKYDLPKLCYFLLCICYVKC